MALSDISRKSLRSDLRSRLAKMTVEEFSEAELNSWLNTAQFDVFVRLSGISDIWYGTKKAITLTAAAGVTSIPLAGDYAPDKISKLKKLVLASGELVPFVTDNEVHSYRLNSNYDYSYSACHFGEYLDMFVGASATALSNNAAYLYFIRKPDEMTADDNVNTILFTGQPTAGKYFRVWMGNRFVNVYARASAETSDDSIFFVTSVTAATNATNLAAALTHAFTGSGITATADTATVTITGATAVQNVDVNNATFAATTSVCCDVPTEYVDLVVMSALSKALFKLNMLGEKQTVDADISNRFNDIRALYSSEIQLQQAEKVPGVQTPRMR